jgi:hypothetical protein
LASRSKRPRVTDLESAIDLAQALAKIALKTARRGLTVSFGPQPETRVARVVLTINKGLANQTGRRLVGTDQANVGCTHDELICVDAGPGSDDNALGRTMLDATPGRRGFLAQSIQRYRRYHRAIAQKQVLAEI